jgi:TonB family protein
MSLPSTASASGAASSHRSIRGYLICSTLVSLVSCTTPFQPHVTKQYSAEWYPPAARRLGEEGRVLVEVHIGKDGKLLQEPTLRQGVLGSSRLTDGAVKVARRMLFDVSGRTKPDPKRAYLVTIIFCLEPGHCDEFAPFPETDAVVVKAGALAPLPPPPERILD